MSDTEEPAETHTESLLRSGKELLDASKQTLLDLDDMLTDDDDDEQGGGVPEPEDASAVLAPTSDATPSSKPVIGSPLS